MAWCGFSALVHNEEQLLRWGSWAGCFAAFAAVRRESQEELLGSFAEERQTQANTDPAFTLTAPLPTPCGNTTTSVFSESHCTFNWLYHHKGLM